MSKKWRYAGLIYLICAFAFAAMALNLAYDSGTFQHQHTPRDWVIFAACFLAMVAFWPYFVGVFLLLYFGILPK